jgi:transposase InsO family protein
LYSTGRLSPRTRSHLVSEAKRLGVTRAARQLGVSRRTTYRWRRRQDSYLDRSSRPHHSPRRTSDAQAAAILGLRLELRWGPDRLGPYLGLPASTAYAVLRRFKASRLRVLFPVERPRRGTYTALRPGELVAIDIKSLGRLDRGGGRRAQAAHRSHGHSTNVGWRHLHVAIDMASRLVYAELRPGLGLDDTLSFLAAALAFFDARGLRVQRILTDNGPGYRRRFGERCGQMGMRHTRIKPHHPWTNGRAEAFIGTIQRECFYAGSFFTSEEERGLALWLYLAYYNGERPHTAIGGLSPERWLRDRGVTHLYGDFS